MPIGSLALYFASVAQRCDHIWPQVSVLIHAITLVKKGANGSLWLLGRALVRRRSEPFHALDHFGLNFRHGGFSSLNLLRIIAESAYRQKHARSTKLLAELKY